MHILLPPDFQIPQGLTKMKLPWVQDPKDGKESVTATLVVLSALAMLVAIGLDLAGKAKGTGLIADFFWGSLATYLGRRLTFGKGQTTGPVEGEQK